MEKHIYDENGNYLKSFLAGSDEEIKQQEGEKIIISDIFLGEKVIIENEIIRAYTRIERIEEKLEELNEGEFIKENEIILIVKPSNLHIWNTKTKKWELNKEEYVKFLKKEIEKEKEKIIENGFEYEINSKQVIQKCREKDKSNILGTMQLLNETKQSIIDWKFNDENNNDVIEKITPGNLKEMLIRGAQLTSKGIETEQKLFYVITKLTDKQLEKFNVEDEFLKLMEE